MEPDFISELKLRFRRGDITLQLIYINVAVFLIVTIVGALLKLFGVASPLYDLLAMPASLPRFVRQPWSILTYMFMHADVLHILFNMLWLYCFGPYFLAEYSANHLRGLYIFGGICGGLLYMLAFNVFPYFEAQLEGSLMVGASASVLAIIVAAAVRVPERRLYIFPFGMVSLKFVALGVVLIDLLFITSSNSGGHIAHIGGALAGLAFAIGLECGVDLTSWINKVLNALNRRSVKPRMKVNYGGKRAADYDYNARRKANADAIDAILDKIKKSGYDSLTSEEKKSLFDASRK
jgi:membrane associated rhomboid family serine protease